MGRLEDGELHPLQNQLILEIIFRKTSFANLKAYRQVCKQWYLSSMELWKPMSRLRISGNAQLKEIIKCLKDNRNKSAIQFKNWFPPQIRLEDVERNLTTFCKYVGSSIKTLELIRCQFPSIDAFRLVIFKESPNLENLTLQSITLQNVDLEQIVEPTEWVEPQFPENRNLKSLKLFWNENVPISWMELLSHFPAIESLTIKKLRKFQQIFQTINIICKHDPEKLKLKHINGSILVWIQKRPECLDVLLDPRLSLETLTVAVYECRGTQAFLEVLSFHAGTLRKLSIKGWAFMEIRPFNEFPPILPHKSLDKLEILKLKNRALPSLAFLKFTPNLRKLVLQPDASRCIEETEPVDVTGFVLPSLKELEIYDAYVTKESLLRLITWFPNVEILRKNGLDNVLFSLVCKNWNNLKSLIVTKSRVNDYGKLEFWHIADLKYLKYFSLDTKDEPGRSFVKETCEEITLEYSATADVIEKLPNLRHLRIKNYKFSDDTRWNKLLAKYPWQ